VKERKGDVGWLASIQNSYALAAALSRAAQTAEDPSFRQKAKLDLRKLLDALCNIML
jgi:hypothetical protein